MQTDQITLIVALITAIAAIIAPVVSSIISSIYAYKIKSAELIFDRKINAYQDCLRAIADITIHKDYQTLSALQHSTYAAFLFASQDTSAKLSSLGQELISDDSSSPEALSRQIDALWPLVEAMKSEIKKYDK